MILTWLVNDDSPKAMELVHDELTIIWDQIHIH